MTAARATRPPRPTAPALPTPRRSPPCAGLARRAPRGGPERADPGARGFTLVEIMVAAAITSMVMLALYSILNASLKARDQLENEARIARVGPEILDLIESDLRRLWVMSIDGDRVFEGASHTINGEHADSMVFLSTVDSLVSRRIGERDALSDVCETGYRLRRNPQLPDVLELYRRHGFHVDEEPLEDGAYQLVHDRVVSFRVRYHERLEEFSDPVAEWKTEERRRLPAAVEIDLVLEVVPRTVELSEDADRTLRYHRVIPLLPESDLCMRVRTLPPTFTGVGAGGGAGATGRAEEGDGSTPEGVDSDNLQFDDIFNEDGTTNTGNDGSNPFPFPFPSGG